MTHWARDIGRAAGAIRDSEWVAPTPQTMLGAVRWLRDNADDHYAQSTVSVNPFGDVVAEFIGCGGSKRLTIYVRKSGEVEYLAAWGPHMVDEMCDGAAVDPAYLFRWLTTAQEMFDAAMAAGVRM